MYWWTVLKDNGRLFCDLQIMFFCCYAVSAVVDCVYCIHSWLSSICVFVGDACSLIIHWSFKRSTWVHTLGDTGHQVSLTANLSVSDILGSQYLQCQDDWGAFKVRESSPIRWIMLITGSHFCNPTTLPKYICVGKHLLLLSPINHVNLHGTHFATCTIIWEYTTYAGLPHFYLLDSLVMLIFFAPGLQRLTGFSINYSCYSRDQVGCQESLDWETLVTFRRYYHRLITDIRLRYILSICFRIVLFWIPISFVWVTDREILKNTSSIAGSRLVWDIITSDFHCTNSHFTR